ncbi:MAG: carbohydrate kinase [Cyclobacteriaceae bacterium]
MKFLGIDVGSSSVKVSVFDADKQQTLASTFFPKSELAINSPVQGWAEQDPSTWWESIKGGLKEISTQTNLKEVAGIGISYQMHGLVAVDKDKNPVRPSIIWCDSRAVETGNEAFNNIGHEKSLSHLLNSPGNFTAAKLGWVKENEPDLYSKINKVMLPGDFVAMKLSGEINTTSGGMSEGVFWDFKNRKVSADVKGYFGFDDELIPPLMPIIGEQSRVSESAAAELGLSSGIPITYRAGDQPNNALSLNVLEPGELATTAGTSAVIYAVSDKNEYDPDSRVNTFLHVNDKDGTSRNGILLCVNGSGILYSWLKKLLSIGGELDYPALNDLASQAPIGADGLCFMPFGNGAERILKNQNLGAQMINLDFNRHGSAHMVRAAKEGIVNAMNYGLEIIRSMDVPTTKIRAGASNLFLSPLFREAFVNTTGVPLELYETDGAEGAARGAAIGAGYQTYKEAFDKLKLISIISPTEALMSNYQQSYQDWKGELNKLLNV